MALLQGVGLVSAQRSESIEDVTYAGRDSPEPCRIGPGCRHMVLSGGTGKPHCRDKEQASQ